MLAVETLFFRRRAGTGPEFSGGGRGLRKQVHRL